MELRKVFIEKLLYPVMEKRRGNHIREYTRELSESSQMTPNAITGIQERKLRELLKHCVTNVPAYKSLSNLLPQIEEEPFEAIKQFPILTKEAFRFNPDSFFADGVKKEGLVLVQTGGSTGEPLKFYIDRRAVEHYEAARWRGLSWWGITNGSRSVMIWGNPFDLAESARKKYLLKEKYLKNRIIVSAYDINPERIRQITRMIEGFKPEYIYGYCSAVYSVAKMMNEAGIKLRCGLKAVVSTSETLHDYQRAEMEKAFMAPVANEYGARDAGILGYECRHGGMHLTLENAYMELFDPLTGEYLPGGGSGRLVVTDLNNFSMPRIRYRMGDVVTTGNVHCECGVTLPLLSHIDGREDSMLIRKDGGLVHGDAFARVARVLDSVVKFQIIQKSMDKTVVKVVFDSLIDSYEKDREAMVNGVRALLPGAEVLLKEVADIPVSGSGKVRYAICEIE